MIAGGYTDDPIDFGCCVSSSGSFDTPFLVKLSPSGACVWSKTFTTGQTAFGDQVKGVATDASGNVYATIAFLDAIDVGGGIINSAGAGHFDTLVAKFAPGGALLWAKSFGDALDQFPTSIAVDASGNVAVAGYFIGSINFGGGALTTAGGTDIFVAKLTTDGNHVWSNRFGDTTNQRVDSIAFDGSGNLLLTGSFSGTVNFGTTSATALTSAGGADMYIAKLSPLGAHVWSKSFGSTGDDGGIGIAADPSGNVVVAGFFSAGSVNLGGTTFTNQGGNDGLIVKFSPLGAHVWSKSFGGAKDQGAQAITADGQGYVTISAVMDGTADFGGGTLTTAGAQDGVIARYDPSGTFLWARQYGDSHSQFARSVAANASGDVAITGLTNGPVDFGGGPVCGLGGEDIFIAELAP